MDGTGIATHAAFGLAYGVILQRSGFCFARAGLEPFLLRAHEACDGVVAGLVAATVGFAVVAAATGAEANRHLIVLPLGAGTALGGVCFGLGMTLAGMCAAGSLVRMGEGYAVGGAALLGLVAGALADPFTPAHLGVPGNQARASLGELLGSTRGAAVTIAALLGLGWAARRRARGEAGRDASSGRAVIGGLLLGGVNTLQAWLASPWTITYPLAALPRVVGGRAGAPLEQAVPFLALDGALVAGALASQAMGSRVRLRWPRSPGDLARAFAGGALMAWGVGLAHGCAIGGLFSALPSLSLSAWVFLPAILVGAYLGSRLLAALARRG